MYKTLIQTILLSITLTIFGTLIVALLEQIFINQERRERKIGNYIKTASKEREEIDAYLNCNFKEMQGKQRSLSAKNIKEKKDN